MGSFSILNNISGVNAQNQLNINNVNLSRTLMRLSSGKRINSGADDAAGLQIADSLRANTAALDQAVRNANDGIGVCQIADGSLQEITNLLTRAVTLAEEASTETVDQTGRNSLDAEFTSIKSEISRIASQTAFNGYAIFTAGSGVDGKLDVFVGDISAAAASSSIGVTIDSISATSIGGANISDDSLADTATAQTSLTEIKSAIDGISTMRATIGAGMNRLQSAVAVLQTQSQNTQAAESVIRDANFAQEVASLTKFQILAQSGMAALAQANSSSQSVLSLLRG